VASPHLPGGNVAVGKVATLDSRGNRARFVDVAARRTLNAGRGNASSLAGFLQLAI
jgi:hypothetical protein